MNFRGRFHHSPQPHAAVAAGTTFPVASDVVGQPLAGIEGVPVLLAQHSVICIILHYNVYYFHFTLQELC